jgi:hypothetical protein
MTSNGYRDGPSLGADYVVATRIIRGSMAAVALLLGSCSTGGQPRASALPGLIIDHRTREVVVDGRVCLKSGILEYLAVSDGGKEYESLFALQARPSHLQAALLIAGFQQGEIAEALRGDFSPAADPAGSLTPEGAPPVTRPTQQYFATAGEHPSRVVIDVEVGRAGERPRLVPVEHFLTDRRTGKEPARITWAFTGSFFHHDELAHREFFAADMEKSLIALWYDPTALLNPAWEMGNPYRGERCGLEINTAIVPPANTPVRLIIRRSSP